MKRSIRFLILPAILLGSAFAHADGPPNYDAYFDKAAAQAVTPPVKIPVAAPDGAVASMDTRRNIPKFIWAGSQKPMAPATLSGSAVGAARWYIGQYARRWDLPREIADNADLVHVHDLGHGGIIVTLRQSIDGVEVHRNDIKVLMNRSHELIAISGSPRSTAAAELKHGKAFKLTGPQAIASAMSDLYSLPAKAVGTIDIKRIVGPYSYYDLAVTPEVKAKDLHLVEPFRVKKVFYPMPDRLVPAYFLEIQAGSTHQATADAYGYVIAADDGRVLYRQNLTDHVAFNYRVWADQADGRPLDGPIADWSPHPTGTPDTSYPPFIAPTLISMDGFNHNPNNMADSWLAANAVQTLGNNVDCYVDDDNPDGLSNGDFRATLTGALTFDRVYDTAQAPQVSQNQTMAALTQLFYDVNYLHDWWYDSGFNEAAGNAQQNNFGRGGFGGDVLHAEGQDGANPPASQRNNANMSTPADGASPRMQMYLWSGVTATLTELPNTSMAAGTAAFGAQIFDLTNSLVYANDGVAGMGNPPGTPNDGCETIMNNVAGKIALVDRGFCPFVQKAAIAQAAGAVGLIIANNAPLAGAPGMSGSDPTVTIPVLSTATASGAKLKADLMAGPVNMHMVRVVGMDVDGTIDNVIVGHEWGHYLHHRLVQCGLLQCGGMSEGWGDFEAMSQIIVRQGDNFDGTFATGIYATIQGFNAGYYGVRRWPYTTDMTKNGLTFKHIANGVALPLIQAGSFGGTPNSEVHNVGEVWTSMLWEAYSNILKLSLQPNPRYDFTGARRAMTDYLVGGMKLAPVEPTITEQRDAILAASYASQPLDTQLIADGFAKRGAGTCAVSPPVDTADNTGVVESFTSEGNYVLTGVTIDDSVKSCDNDGALDANETGNANVTLVNTFMTKLTNTMVTLSSSTPGVTFPNGASTTVANIDPFTSITVPIQIALDNTVTMPENLDLTVNVSNAVGCQPMQTLNVQPLINYDNLPTSSNIDTVESDILGWTPNTLAAPGKSVDAADVWTRELSTPTNHVWHGIDAGANSDTAIESPALNVSNAAPFIITVKHRYGFEQGGGINWDGGVIEISTNGGMNWVDINTYVNPGYGGSIGEATNAGHNALFPRPGFVGKSAGFPNTNTLTLNLGNMVAGKTVKVRFRVASDDNTGAFGWELDNLQFQGITNSPFPSVVNDASACSVAMIPIADAGPDQTVHVGDGVILDGSMSSSPNNLTLSYDWTQTAGFIVPLSNPNISKPTWVAPPVVGDTTFTFKLKVSDANGSASDTVNVVVQPMVVTGSGGGGGASASSSSSSSGMGGAGGAASSSTSSSSKASSSSSSSSSTGEGGAGGAGPETSTDGCGCSTPGSDANSGALSAGLLGLGLALIRRRRQQKAS